MSRNDLAERTQLSRSAISQRLGGLLDIGLISSAPGASTGGRIPSVFSFNAESGAVLSAEFGETRFRLLVTDLAATPRAEIVADNVDMTDGPEAALTWAEEQFIRLLDQAGVKPAQVRAVGIGIPAPVDTATGQAMLPPSMPSWDGYPIPQRLQKAFPVPVLVDNNVNMMALAEQRIHHRDIPELLFVHLGTGIDSGVIANHRVYHGADGAAGSLGHVYVPAGSQVLCRCGKFGCLDAVASGAAVVRRLNDQGIAVSNALDVVREARSGNMMAIELVRECGRLVGEVLATAVNVLNPRVVVIGGDLAHADEHVMPGIRELIYQRAFSLATRSFRIVRSRLGDMAAAAGAAVMAADHVLSPDKIDESLTTDAPYPSLARHRGHAHHQRI